MLLQSVTVTDPASAHHGRTVDLRVEGGRIVAVATSLTPTEGEEIFTAGEARVAPGFVDIGAYVGDPGHEEREDLTSLAAAAALGGYVAVAVLPNTDPVRQSAADMSYLRAHAGRGAVDLLPLAALSTDTAGDDLTQMMELSEVGALAFTDGPDRPARAGLLRRGLEYARGFGGLLIDTPFSYELAGEGQMHEGEVSVRLGLRGIPSLCETIPLRRNLSLLDYTGGRLIVHLLTSAEAVDIVAAYRNGTASHRLGTTVSAHHLTFTHDAVAGFDPNYKLHPPLREVADRERLWAGLGEGTIDAIVSNHFARNGEEKDLEFSYADFGARGLETAFRQLLDPDDRERRLSTIVAALGAGPRRLLGLPPVSVEEGSPAQLTVFTLAGEATLTADQAGIRTANHPLFGRALPGRILATVNNDRLWTSA